MVLIFGYLCVVQLDLCFMHTLMNLQSTFLHSLIQVTSHLPRHFLQLVNINVINVVNDSSQPSCELSITSRQRFDIITSLQEMLKGMSNIQNEGFILSVFPGQTFHKSDIERVDRLIEILNPKSLKWNSSQNHT